MRWVGKKPACRRGRQRVSAMEWRQAAPRATCFFWFFCLSSAVVRSCDGRRATVRTGICHQQRERLEPRMARRKIRIPRVRPSRIWWR